MVGGNPAPKATRPALVDRRIQRILNARSVTVGLAMTFLSVSFVGAIVMWLVDRHNFPTLGLAFWWGLQTVTTVGYGDVVPTTGVGRVVGGLEMVFGVSFIAFLTAGVTSTVIQRAQAKSGQPHPEPPEPEAEAILDALAELRQAVAEVDRRLASIESRLL
jgi:hypothetical protein